MLTCYWDEEKNQGNKSQRSGRKNKGMGISKQEMYSQAATASQLWLLRLRSMSPMRLHEMTEMQNSLMGLKREHYFWWYPAMSISQWWRSALGNLHLLLVHINHSAPQQPLQIHLTSAHTGTLRLWGQHTPSMHSGNARGWLFLIQAGLLSSPLGL